jgi:hypothetical protein
MSQDVVNVLKFVVDDDTAAGFSSANRNLKKNERAIQRVIEQQKKLTREAGKSADQIAIETLKRADAKDEVIAQVMALQKERQAIMDAKSARTESINEVDKMIAAMKEQAATIGMSSSELAIHKAVQKGATAEQLAAIQATQAEINAKKQASTATVNQVNSAEQMIQKLRQEIDLFGKSDDQILAYKLALDGATQAQIDEVMALRSKMAAMNRSLPLMQRMKQQLRFMRGGFGQVGHQIQDVAVQLQTGTDAMIVFGQQGSQIVSLFGPGGAALGALLAVGAAAFTAFKNFEVTNNELAELRSQIEDFTPESDEATAALQRMTAVMQQQEINNMRDDLFSLIEEMDTAGKTAFMAQTQLEQMSDTLSADEKQALRDRINSAGMEAVIAEGKIRMLKQGIENLGATVFNFPKEDFFAAFKEMFEGTIFGEAFQFDQVTPEIDTSDAEEAANKFLGIERSFLDGVKKINSDFDRIEEQIRETAGIAGIEGDRLNNAIAANEAQRQAALSRFHEQEYAAQVAHSEALRQERLAREKAIADIEQQNRERARETREGLLDDFEASLAREEELLASQREMRQANMDHMFDVMAREDKFNKDMATAKINLNAQVLSSAQALTSGLLSNMSKESSAYKAVFAAQQAIAIATTLINTEMAATAALAPPPVGLGPVAGVGYAKVIRGLGYASVGLIAAQTAMSFEGGGFTGRGSRSGGIDGRGGFPAILHPNETVVDHEGGGMQPVVVNQTINVTTGIQQTVRAEIANLLPQISEAAKAAVADSRMRGGSYGTSMGV